MKRDRTVWLTQPDAERLSLMQKFVRSPLEGRHLVALERKIALATICHPADVPADLVTMNSQVLLRDTETGDGSVYTLVFPMVENARKNRISILGSLGRALLGARVGDAIDYLSSAGRRLQTVEKVLYQPWAAGAVCG